MSSDAGDYPGNGAEYFYSSPGDQFEIVAAPPNVLVLHVNYTTTTDWWQLSFAAPNGAQLTPGTYFDVARYPFQYPELPGMDVGGIGRGCNTLSGGFRVKESHYDPSGALEALWLVFEQHCEGRAPALHGDLRINADAVVAVDAPFDLRVQRLAPLSFDVTSRDVDGRHITLTASSLPDGATFTEHGDGTGTFAWTPGFAQQGTYEVSFHGDNGAGSVDDVKTRITVPGTTSLLVDSEAGDFVGQGQLFSFAAEDGSFNARRQFNGVTASFLSRPVTNHSWSLGFAAPGSADLTPGSYAGATRFPFQAPENPGLDISGEGRGCNTLYGDFEIKQIEFGSRDVVTKLWATFEQHCEGMAPALRGELRVNADVPVVVRAPATVAGVERRALSFGIQGFELAGGVVSLSASGLPSGAVLTDHADGTATFRWTPAASQVGEHVIRVEARGTGGVTDSLPVRLTIHMTGDDRENAIPIARLPFSDARDISRATRTDGEPICLSIGPAIWYVITPDVDTDIDAVLSDHAFNASIAAYTDTGTGPGLRQLDCSDERIRFTALGGATTYILVRDADLQVSLSVTGRPALTLKLDTFGSFDMRTGRATVGGTVACERPGMVTIEGHLAQSLGRGVAAEFSTVVDCSDRARWSATAIPASGSFRGGVASVDVDATSSPDDESPGAHAHAAGRVRLLGVRRRF
jgi:hypothetical protein